MSSDSTPPPLKVNVKTETGSSSADKKWYDANCHCRNVVYRVKLPPLYPEEDIDTSAASFQDHVEHEAQRHEVTSCNCSICTKNGMLALYPAESELEFLKGEETLTSYMFGNKSAEHKFCPICGSSVYTIIRLGGMDKLAVNVGSDPKLLLQTSHAWLG